MPEFTFTKAERLKSRKTIGQLFKEGSSFGQFPLRLVWMKVEVPQGEAPFQFAMSVPKRSFPKAVHRNLLRRRLREAYRLNKHKLYAATEGEPGQFALLFIYIAREALPYATIEQAMLNALGRVSKKVNAMPPKT